MEAGPRAPGATLLRRWRCARFRRRVLGSLAMPPRDDRERPAMTETSSSPARSSAEDPESSVHRGTPELSGRRRSLAPRRARQPDQPGREPEPCGRRPEEGWRPRLGARLISTGWPDSGGALRSSSRRAPTGSSAPSLGTGTPPSRLTAWVHRLPHDQTVAREYRRQTGAKAALRDRLERAPLWTWICVIGVIGVAAAGFGALAASNTSGAWSDLWSEVAQAGVQVVAVGVVGGALTASWSALRARRHAAP